MAPGETPGIWITNTVLLEESNGRHLKLDDLDSLYASAMDLGKGKNERQTKNEWDN